MEQFDPNIPGLMEGALARVAVTDPQPFVGGRSPAGPPMAADSLPRQD